MVWPPNYHQLPQLVENYRLKSAQGVSLAFLTIWLVGDVTNLIGAIFARLVPTVTALAIYFCISDFILITQCLYYRNSVARFLAITPSAEQEDVGCQEPLLRPVQSTPGFPGSRRGSSLSAKGSQYRTQEFDPAISGTPRTLLKTWSLYILILVAVALLGLLGWSLAYQTGLWEPIAQSHELKARNEPVIALVLGYTSALCYLGYFTSICDSAYLLIYVSSARIPQVLKNFREKSCDGDNVRERTLVDGLKAIRPCTSFLFAITSREFYLRRRRELGEIKVQARLTIGRYCCTLLIVGICS